MAKEQNNFDFIRLIAAAIVVVSHTYGFSGIASDPLKSLTAGKLNFGDLGVQIFFVISGYLICKSYLNHPSFVTYFTNRVLRIFPGLITVVLFAAFVVGPVFTNLSLKQYFTNIHTFSYLQNISMIKLQYALPGTFTGLTKQGVDHTVNAPLWTLVFEFMMYIVIFIYGLIGMLRTNRVSLLFNAAIFAFFSISLFKPEFFQNHFALINRIVLLHLFAKFYVYFFAGVALNYFISQIRFRWYFALGLLVIWYFSIPYIFFDLISLFTVAYIVFYIAYIPVRLGYAITKLGDFSYGMYLYGYVVQNMVQYNIGNEINLYLKMLIMIVLTVPFAVASWFLVEKNALSLKKKTIHKPAMVAA